MADITVTPANVAVGAPGARTRVVQVGEAVTQGKSGYLDAATGKYRLADANLSLAAAAATGVFLTAAGSDGYALIMEAGEINLGATLVKGTVYVVSATAGGIAPAADLTTGWHVTILGVASSASLLQMGVRATGIEV